MPTRHSDPRDPSREPHRAATMGVRCAGARRASGAYRAGGVYRAGRGRRADMYSYNKHATRTDCTPPAKRATCSRGALAAVAARTRMLYTLAAVAAHAPAYSTRSLRGHHSASDERPTLLSAGSCTMSQADTHTPCMRAADGRLASTRSAGLRRMHACRCGGLRSARARPLRCGGVALRRRSAQPALHASVGGADAAAMA